MINTKHTPGPWESNFSSSGILSVMKIWPSKQYPDNKELFDIQTICPIRPFDKLTEEDEPNAKLIAAAPEMLEVLQLIAEYHEHDAAWSEYGDKIKSAIKKATE